MSIPYLLFISILTNYNALAIFALSALTLGCFMLFIKKSPSFVSLLLLMLSVYLYFLTFHLTGFVIYHKRHELGLEAFVSPEREQAEQLKLIQFKVSDIVQEIYRLTMALQYQAAIDVLYKQTAKYNNNLEIQKDLFYRILFWEEEQVVLVQGRRYLSLLLDQHIFTEAFRVYWLCWQRSSKFSPPELISEHILRLAKLAHTYGEYQLALVIKILLNVTQNIRIALKSAFSLRAFCMIDFNVLKKPKPF